MFPSSLRLLPLCLLLTNLALAKVVQLRKTDEMICPTPDDCYPKLFHATKEFQVRREGQEFERGLHVQVDVTTGEVRAKLNEDETSKTAVLKTVVLEPDTVSVKELVSVGTQTSEPEIHPEPETVSVKVEEKKEPDFSGFTSKQRYTQSDEERYLTSLAMLIRGSNETEQDEGKIKEMLLAMEEVENLVHTIAFGIKLSKGKGMVTVMDLLNHKDERVRKSAALVLGSAMQNNPPVQHAAQKLDIVQAFLHRLPIEEIPGVVSPLMYALSAAVCGNHDATHILLDKVHGLTHLTELWERFDDEHVRKKLVVFVTDLLDANMDPETSNDEFSEQIYAENVNLRPDPTLNMQTDQGQTDSLFPNDHPAEESTDVSARVKGVRKWCSLFSKSLISASQNDSSMDLREKMLRGLSTIRTYYPSACKTIDPSLTVWIKEERSRVVADVDMADYVLLLDEVVAR